MLLPLLLATLAATSLGVPSLPARALADGDKPALRHFAFFDLPVVRRRGVAVVASAEADDDGSSRFAGYDEPAATAAAVPRAADAFLIASPAEVRDNGPRDNGPRDNGPRDNVPRDEAGAEPLGVVPAFTGSFRRPAASPRRVGDGAAITNPAAFFLEGAELERVAPPACRMLGCDGPLADDGDLQLAAADGAGDAACHVVFVPLNGCVNGRGYPVGMACRVCCECAASLRAELLKSRGVQMGFSAEGR